MPAAAAGLEDDEVRVWEHLAVNAALLVRRVEPRRRVDGRVKAVRLDVQKAGAGQRGELVPAVRVGPRRVVRGPRAIWQPFVARRLSLNLVHLLRAIP